MEQKFEAKTFVTCYKCPKCTSGTLNPVTCAVPVPPSGIVTTYEHKCNTPTCGHTMTLDKMYPFFSYELIMPVQQS